MNDSIISKARGALRREGATPGERQAATAALERILKKYDLALADLETQEMDWYPFTYNTYYEKRLLLQLHNKITAGRETHYVGGDGKIELRMTPDELEEMTRTYDAYLAAWREAVDDLWAAFVYKNELYSGIAGQGKDMSLEDTLKAALLGRSLSRVYVPMGTSRRIG